jgi:hypothetical protein
MWRGFAFCRLNTELLTGPAVGTRWHTERYANKENMEARIDCVISGFRREVDENCTLVSYHVASIGSSLPTFRDKLSVPTLKFKNKKKSR